MANIKANDDYLHEEGEFDIVATWLRFQPLRWVSGAMAGVFASLVMLAFAMLLSLKGGYEVWYPVKIGAIPCLGNIATELGFHLGPIVIGLITLVGGCAILGVIYSHFVGTQKFMPLLGMGFVWGTFSWIFICNLFLPSFPLIRALDLSHGATFFICVVFGLALSSLSIIDSTLSGKKD